MSNTPPDDSDLGAQVEALQAQVAALQARQADQATAVAAPAPSAVPANTGSHLACPQCHQIDQAQRVGAILQEGISNKTFKAGIGGIGVTSGGHLDMVGARATVRVQSRTKLSESLTLRPPPAVRSTPPQPSEFTKQARETGCLTALGILAAVVAIPAGVAAWAQVFTSTTAQSGSDKLSAVFFGTVLLLAGLLGVYGIWHYYKHRGDERHKDTVEWREAMATWEAAQASLQGRARVDERWQDLYWCHRCAGLYDPIAPHLGLNDVKSMFVALYTQA